MKRLSKNVDYETKRIKNDECPTPKIKNDVLYMEDTQENTDSERLKKMERENEDLRKRCTRLENIVTQILSNKEESKSPGVNEKFIGSKPLGNNATDDLASYEIYNNCDTKASYSYSNSKHRVSGYSYAVSPRTSPTKHEASLRECKQIVPYEKVPGFFRTFSMDKHASFNCISSEEMEKRNEFFRSTYYEEQLKHLRNIRPTYPSLLTPLVDKHSPTNEKSHSNKASPNPQRYEAKKELQHPYASDLRCENHYEPYLFGRSVQQKVVKHVGYCHTRHKSNDSNLFLDKCCYNAKHSESLEIKKYDSEFFTKLPPKLHIVESQNKNGVTLTWNATSNTDSSLVKSYQLFARELFGQKLGTMKRMGVIDALPLPMSCNVANLKRNIKYKFAVCAVDIYGRFGKMSNFTGKFELKSNDSDKYKEEESYELKIII
ncbi:uncharacterized protein LOC105845013 [Hydra vulgaris]|uniref:uncharacterized protein LOC105845013 n=1 Tax=Hydra vulgaris TaxID=6087 RepID=UPI0006413C63|nr:uncharacterized protein LOC105845013 [Hydra vulgaris]